MKRNTEVDFWAKVEPVNQNGCRLWKGRVRDKSRAPNHQYGVFNYQNQEVYAHRLAWMFTHGVNLHTVKGAVIMHMCDTPLCCEPLHLRLGTVAENNADRDIKGHQTKGSKHGPARFTEEHVHMMRQLRKRGWKLKRIASIFETDAASISHICNYKIWRHV